MIAVDKGTRFGIHILDSIGFIILLIGHAFLFDGVLHIIPEEGSPFLAVYFFVLYFAYFFLFELCFRKTPGKFITGTQVADLNGDRPTPKELLIRNLSRLIPFDTLSFLFGDTGWHDSISETTVIKADSSATPPVNI